MGGQDHERPHKNRPPKCLAGVYGRQCSRPRWWPPKPSERTTGRVLVTRQNVPLRFASQSPMRHLRLSVPSVVGVVAATLCGLGLFAGRAHEGAGSVYVAAWCASQRSTAPVVAQVTAPPANAVGAVAALRALLGAPRWLSGIELRYRCRRHRDGAE